MKRILALLLAVFMIAIVSSCKNNPSDTTGNSTTGTAQTDETTDEKSDTTVLSKTTIALGALTNEPFIIKKPIM